MSGTFYLETEILARELNGKNVLFLSHARPDMDTLSSAYALAHIFGPKAKTTWGLCEKLNDSYTTRVSSFSIRPKIIESLSAFDTVVCVDFRSPTQAGPLEFELKKFPGKIVIIDHHHPSSSEFAGKIIKIIRPASAAVAQMVAQIGIELNADFTKPLSSALAMGILTDSAKFAVADADTFSTFSFLLEKSGKTYEQLLNRAIPPLEMGDVVITFQSLRDAKLISVGKFLLVSTNAPYHNSRAANALVQLGADIALGIFQGKDGLFCSVRVSGRAHSVLQFDAMKILPELAHAHDGTCGGHARAAQLNLPQYLSEDIIIDAFARVLQMQVRKKDKDAKLRIY